MMVQQNPAIRTWRGSPYRNFEDFFSNKGVEIQCFSINPSRRTTIIGKQGTCLTFFPFTLIDHEGKLVDENVEIQLIEVFSKMEMILSGKVTTSEDRLLESGGQFCIQGFQNGKPIKLISPIRVALPVRCKLKNALAMHLFQGSTSKTRGFQSGRVFDWTQSSSKPLPIRKIADKKYFHFEIAHFNWWNCDYYFSKRRSKTMVSARPVCHVGYFDDMTAYLVFEHLQSVARMYKGEHGFTSFNIPTNEAATVIMMALQNGQLYFGKKYIPKTSNKLVYVSMEEVNEEELLDFLKRAQIGKLSFSPVAQYLDQLRK